MTSNNPNRYKVSSNFVIVKIFVIAALLIVTYTSVRNVNNHGLGRGTWAPIFFGIPLLACLFYYANTRKVIEYDDIEYVLYVYNHRKEFETAVPLERIEKILFSAIGFNNRGSYLIVYKDADHQLKKVRLFPIAFSNHVNTIITDTRLKNPNLKTRHWSVGWNELTD